MKRNWVSLTIACMALISLSHSSVKAQSPAFTEGLSLRLGGGLTTFYGDLGATGLSVYGNSKAGFSASVIKMMRPGAGIQVQYFAGNMYSLRPDLSQYFGGTLQEIGLFGRIEPFILFKPSFSGNLSPFLRAGLASIGFRSVRRDQGTNTVYLPAFGYATDGVTEINRERALAIPLAFGLSYRLNNKLSLELEHSFDITNTDFIDATVGSTASNDVFGFTQIGLKYTIKPTAPREVIEKPAREKPVSTRSKTKNSSGKPAKTKTKTKTMEDPLDTPTIPEIKPVELAKIYVEALIPENLVAGKVFEVSLRINKGSYSGPAILTQSFPQGFTAIESQLGFARFSFVNQTVRIIWEKIPADSIIYYSYHVRPSEALYGSSTINGGLEYQDPDGIKTIQFTNYVNVDNPIETDMDAKIMELLGEGPAKTNQSGTGNQTIKEDDYALKVEELLNRYGSDSKNPTKTNQSNQNITIKEHKSVSGLEFRVQCGAFSSRKDGQKIISKSIIGDEVWEEYHNGLYKYTVGSFKTYEEALRFRDQFIQKSKIWTAFIVGYQNGVRLKTLSQVLK